MVYAFIHCRGDAEAQALARRLVADKAAVESLVIPAQGFICPAPAEKPLAAAIVIAVASEEKIAAIEEHVRRAAVSGAVPRVAFFTPSRVTREYKEWLAQCFS